MTTLALVVALLWLALGLLPLLCPRSFRLARGVYLPGAALGLLLMLAAVRALLVSAVPSPWTFAGPAGLAVAFRADPLSEIFLLILGSAAFAVSLFARGYFRPERGTPPGILTFVYHLFLASLLLLLLVLAWNVLTFMAAWELMTLSSYALVLSEHGRAEIRRAGLLYLVMAQASGLLLIVAFALLSRGSVLGFGALAARPPGGALASAAFLCALAGFGTKAGLLPAHVWLPEAHPAAPSPVSALMSGVMLETALYGLVRILWILRPVVVPWWGGLLVAVGTLTGLYGVLFAAVQTDIKRLLAYSSIENMGLITTALGLALLFLTAREDLLAVVAFVAALALCLNHTMSKSLLFLAVGSVLHATGVRNLGRLGGLLGRMP